MPDITYTVQAGDTLYSIARRFGTTVDAIARANNISDPSRIYPGQRLIIPVPEGERVYIVQPGDTLYLIAQRFGTSVDVIARRNNLADPSQIFPGQRLIIPEPVAPPTPPGFQRYVVRPGDTLWAIARRFGTTVEAIARANNLADPSLIQVGQVLTIPVAAPPPPAEPVFRGDPGKRMIAFSFDATYGDNQTPRLLEILRTNNITTTFFWSGIWSEAFPDLARAIVQAGHEVGNHSYDHPHMTTLTEAAMRDQILRTEGLNRRIAGPLYRRYFRPPFGEYDQRLLRVASSLGYRTIMWTIDSLDWTNPGPEAIVERVLRNIQNGAIILMHQAAPDTPRALPIIISRLFRDGYRISTVTAVLDPH